MKVQLAQGWLKAQIAFAVAAVLLLIFGSIPYFLWSAHFYQVQETTVNFETHTFFLPTFLLGLVIGAVTLFFTVKTANPIYDALARNHYLASLVHGMLAATNAAVFTWITNTIITLDPSGWGFPLFRGWQLFVVSWIIIFALNTVARIVVFPSEEKPAEKPEIILSR